MIVSVHLSVVVVGLRLLYTCKRGVLEPNHWGLIGLSQHSMQFISGIPYFLYTRLTTHSLCELEQLPTYSIPLFIPPMFALLERTLFQSLP